MTEIAMTQIFLLSLIASAITLAVATMAQRRTQPQRAFCPARRRRSR